MKNRRRAWMTLVLFIAAAVGQTVGQTIASAGTFPGTNGKIAFASEGYIRVINADGTGRATLDAASPASSVAEPAWNATGSKLVFRTGSSSFSTMNANGSNVKRLVSMDRFAGNPTWSADGRKVAFDYFIGGTAQEDRIYVVPAAGGTATELVALDAKDPTYSPDGTKIAYENHADASPDIGVMDADGSGAANITSGASGNNGDHDPSWSPDGTKIAFTRALQIWATNADGSGTTQLTTGVDASYPTWSPDGTQIAFQRDEDIWVMNSDGSDATNITNTPNVDEREPDWGVAQTVHRRGVSLALKRHLQATGKVTVADGSQACIANVPVKITRNGTVVAKARTNDAGAYKVKLKDKSGRYKAIAPELSPAAGGICSKAGSPERRHSH